MDRQPVPEERELSPRALPRFFVAPEVLKEGVLPSAVAHQVAHVLRLRSGDRICLLDGTGDAWIARLGERGQFRLIQRYPLTTEPPLEVVVLQALVRSEKLEQAIRLCVQGGVSAVWVAPSQRSVVKLEASKGRTRQERWQKIAAEEAELACRARLPQIRLFEYWWEAFEALPKPILVLDEWEHTRLLNALLREWQAADMASFQALALVVGPEGGFSPEERARMAQSESVYAVSLGARVLRTESAGFYALAQLWACWEDN
ncbi:MAG: 16S rRNA (uracil(1498)-N(3))-methyltransferase [Fimbriimonadales bacterium]|nr:16S rRNA (uracil(1498)-N(3))-methyltransferase [Fimbriimonadales bacterium]